MVNSQLLPSIIFYRFLFHWTHLKWRCSKTQLYQTTSQRKRRVQRGRSSEQFLAPQLRKVPVEAGSTLLPASYIKHSTGETGPVWCLWSSYATRISLLLCVTSGLYWMLAHCRSTFWLWVKFLTFNNSPWILVKTKNDQHVLKKLSFYLDSARLVECRNTLEKNLLSVTYIMLLSFQFPIKCKYFLLDKLSMFSLHVKKCF